MKILRNSFRIIVALVFIFSGFVKGVDPQGTAFRIVDYFTAFGIPWAGQFSLFLSIILIMTEFTIGISLLFNLWIRVTAWLLLLMMTYFTVLTFVDAVWNLVPDCGCFGDAIHLTNLQTFIKNIFLMGLVIPVFLWRKKYRSVLPLKLDIVILIIVAAGFTLMSVEAVRHLPLIDFMDWKKGNRINRQKTLPMKFYVTYKNRKTGEKKEYLSSNYPWNDSVWMSQWVFVSQRVEDPNPAQAASLRIEDSSGNDVTPLIMQHSGFQFLLVSYDLEQTNLDAFCRILPLYKKAVSGNISFICLTSSLPACIRQFRLKHGTAFDYYNADDVILKTMIRSNPGLILLKDGVVLDKWGYRDFPSYETVSRKYISQQ